MYIRIKSLVPSDYILLTIRRRSISQPHLTSP
jgi:hypothetical protein